MGEKRRSASVSRGFSPSLTICPPSTLRPARVKRWFTSTAPLSPTPASFPWLGPPSQRRLSAPPLGPGCTLPSSWPTYWSALPPTLHWKFQSIAAAARPSQWLLCATALSFDCWSRGTSSQRPSSPSASHTSMVAGVRTSSTGLIAIFVCPRSCSGEASRHHPPGGFHQRGRARAMGRKSDTDKCLILQEDAGRTAYLFVRYRTSQVSSGWSTHSPANFTYVPSAASTRL